MDSIPLKLEQLSVSRIQSLPRAQTVVFQPIGGIEPHGQEYPIGCDVLEAVEMAEFLASAPNRNEGSETLRKMVSVLANPIEFSPQLHLKKKAPQLGGIFFKQILLNRIQLLENMGFSRVVWITGTRTPRHLGILYEVLDSANRKKRSAHLLLGYQEKPSALMNSSNLFPSTKSHGATFEKALTMRLQIHTHPTDVPPQPIEHSFKKWWFHELPDAWESQKSPLEEHTILLQRERNQLILLLEDFLREPNLVTHLAPSGAYLPWNRSYLRSYLLGFLTTILWVAVLAWAMSDLMVDL